ncbi:MAG: hypothetical protein LUD72_14075 [Bacteroidales bacterium]|nr:hypothetical protein [Bacteroidales bacterium]
MSTIDDLIQRNKPMKIISLPRSGLFLCPSCSSAGISAFDNFCRDCGQRLKWEDDIIDVLEKTGKFIESSIDYHEAIGDILIPLKEEDDDG